MTIFKLCNQDGLSVEDAITFVRGKLVPDGYVPHTYRRNVPESFIDKLRSIIATCIFRASISHWQDQGVDFSSYMYVPEKDPTTNDYHHEREDHCHILKRIAKHTRQGANQQLNLERFDEAMRDSSTGVTHAALVGSRPQSVPDAERLLSHHVADFFERYIACTVYHIRVTYIPQQRQSTGFQYQQVHRVLTTSGPLALPQHKGSWLALGTLCNMYMKTSNGVLPV